MPVALENICQTVAGAGGTPAIDAISLYSVRTPDQLLQATLEVATFKSGLDTNSLSFRQSVVAQIGDTSTVTLRVGHDLVYVTTSRGLISMSWFRGAHLLVLNVRDAFAHPKALLRQAMEIQP